MLEGALAQRRRVESAAVVPKGERKNIRYAAARLPDSNESGARFPDQLTHFGAFDSVLEGIAGQFREDVSDDIAPPLAERARVEALGVDDDLFPGGGCEPPREIFDLVDDGIV